MHDDPLSTPPPLVQDPRRPRRLSLIRIIGTLLSLALLVYLVRAQGWDEFAGVLRKVPPQIFWLSIALMIASRLCVSLRWFVLLRARQVKISFWQTLRLVFMGLFASNFLPTTVGGDLVRMAGAVALRVDAGIAAASLVLDRLVGMAGMSSLAPVGLVIVLGPAAGLAEQAAVLPTVLPLSSGLSVAAVRLPGLGWLIQRLKKFFTSIVSSAGYWLKHPGSLLLALLCTYGHMFFTFMVIYVLLLGMGQPLAFWWIAGLWSLSYFITLVPVSINGLGLQELSISLLYSHFGGVSTEAGLALALFMRMLPLIASLPGVLFLPDIVHPPAAQPIPPSSKTP